jgi:hypothetical protein
MTPAPCLVWLLVAFAELYLSGAESDLVSQFSQFTVFVN